MKIHHITLVGGLAVSVTAARAAVTFEIDADLVTNSTGTGPPDGAAFFLVADRAKNGFALNPSGNLLANSAWGGSADDLVIASFMADGNNNFGNPGSEQHTVSNMVYVTFTNAT